MRRIEVLIVVLLLAACSEEPIPKPRAFLSLNYKKAVYEKLSLRRPYAFEVPQGAVILDEPRNWLKIQYPVQRASLDITYREIDDNLEELITESEKLVFKHTLKAEKISARTYSNDDKIVFVTLHEITGNAASQIQFHITDSTHHFLKGALFFKIKPNYDSILPGVNHIKKDILHLIETFEWNNQ